MASPGDLDTSFSGDGKKTIDFGGVDAANVVLVQPNGRIVVAGGGGAANRFCVARLRSNGVLDTAFGSGGKRVIGFGGGGESDFESAFGAALQRDGKIVLAGSSGVRVAVARLNPNGSPDTTFDGDGTAVIDFGPGSDRAEGAVLQPDGKIVVAGSTQAGRGVAVARLNANGSPDATFGAAGKAAVDFGAATSGHAVALQPNGRIVAAGRRGGDFAVARLLG